jgi:hypothetical protein
MQAHGSRAAANARNHVKAIQAPGRRTGPTRRATEEMPLVTARMGVQTVRTAGQTPRTDSRTARTVGPTGATLVRHGSYWHSNNAAWAFFGGLMLGAAIASLPPRYETVYVSTTPYYYANGVYYTTVPAGGYQVVAAPEGATVVNPPDQVVNVTVNENNYGYANGAYYDVKPPEEEGGEPTYEVIAPPTGAMVPSLPEGSETKTIEGTDYFIYDGTYYRPFYSGSDVVYQVVEDPTAASSGGSGVGDSE